MNTPPPSRIRRVPASPISPSRSPKRRKADAAFESPSNPKIKLHFAGRVYRTPGEAVSPKKLKYAPGPELLGAPDELRIDEAYGALAKQQSSLLASPTLRPSRPKDSLAVPSTSYALSDSDLEIEPAKSPFKTPTKASPISKSSLSSTQYNLNALNAPLPESYAILLNLHTAFERALMLHLTTEGKGGRIASAVSGSSSDFNTTHRIRLENLATYSQLRSMVERGSGRRFGQTEFAQLLWLWNATAEVKPVLDDPFLDSPTSAPASSLGFLVTKTVELSKASGKRVNGWGIGIELDLKRNGEANERSLGIQNSPSSRKQSSPSKMAGKREGMSVVALWSQGAEERKNEIRKRLGRCVVQHHESFLQSITRAQENRPATPPSQSRRKAEASLHADFDLCALPEIPKAPLPELVSGHHTSVHSLNGIASGNNPVKSESDISPPVRKPTAKARASSLMERIKAKEQAQNTGTTIDGQDVARVPNLGMLSPTRKSLKANSAAAERERQRMAAFKRKSMLSRMPNVADAVYMLFAPAAPPSPSSSATAASRYRRAVPLDEVCINIAKSSKVSLSATEAKEALAILTEICPAFVTLKRIEGRDWLTLNARTGEGMTLGQCKEELKRVLVDTL